jgi:hypothetical protein
MAIRRFVAGTTVGCCVVLACWLVYDGTVRAKGVSIRPGVVRVNFPASGDEKTELSGFVEVVNSTKSTVRLLGVSPSCACISIGDWHPEIGPHQSAQIHWSVVKSFDSEQKIWVFTDWRRTPVLVQLVRPASG